MNDTCKHSIVVMGGSFNPPTRAHLTLMTAAIDGVGADHGIFVPSNHAYVKRKMSKTDMPDAIYSEEERFTMLSAMCFVDEQLSADPVEYGYKIRSGNSLVTMDAIQEKNPSAELYFLFGGDKLKTFTKWKTFDEFVQKYRIIVFKREENDPEKEINKTAVLREHRDAFVILPAPVGIENISSTMVRERLALGESAEDYLHPAVWKLICK